MMRTEYDLNDKWRAYAGLGSRHASEIGLYSAPVLRNEPRDAKAGRMDTNRVIASFSGFNTCFVSHKVNFGYFAVTMKDKTAWRMGASAARPEVNVYVTHSVEKP